MVDKFYLVGSGLNANEIENIDKSGATLIGAINNAVFLNVDFDYFFHPYDFNSVKSLDDCQYKSEIIPAEARNDAEISKFGPKIFRGATTSIAVSYWIIQVLRPKQIIYIGCDMNYNPENGGKTHFYGTGTPDPLREHISLTNLDAKMKRLWYFADQYDVELYRYPSGLMSKLPFPLSERDKVCPDFNQHLVKQALKAEASIFANVHDNNFARIGNVPNLVQKLEQIDGDWQRSINAH